MKKVTEEILIDSLKVAENKFEEDILVQQFEKAQSDFKELIKKGYVKERGNNLLSISDQLNITNRSVMFNTPTK